MSTGLLPHFCGHVKYLLQSCKYQRSSTIGGRSTSSRGSNLLLLKDGRTTASWLSSGL